MIWVNIAIWIVSFLISQLLAPKPDVEDARAGTLDDVAFPQATEDAPIPLVLGKVLLKGPNTLWYGDFATIPIIEKIKVSLFKSIKVIVGHRYFLGLDLGLCLGPRVTLREIYIDEELVWEGTLADEGTGTIDAEIFGGHKSGGGWYGDFKYYPGSFPQNINTYVEGQVEAGTLPGYGGQAHIVFEHNEIGESNSLRRMAFGLERYTNTVNAPNEGRIGEDLNPVEALYQVCVDPWIGLGLNPGNIDLANWQQAAVTLAAEQNGVSVVITAPSDGKRLIREILRQIDGIMFQDPATGLLRLKLIRNDYAVRDLPLFDEHDVLRVRSYTKTAWNDVITQVKASFPQRDSDSDAVAVSQDQATAAMLGRMKTVSVSFPFCYDRDLANRLAARERAQLSVPLFRMTLEMNRNAYSLRPGDVFKLNWPEFGARDLVLRVVRHDLGELLNNRIVIECVQDVFAVDTPVFGAPETSGWVAPVTRPQSIGVFIATMLPAFLARKLSFPVPDGYAQPLFLAVAPGDASTAYSVVGGITRDPLDITEPALALYPATGILAAEYSKTAGQETGIDVVGFVLNSPSQDFESAANKGEVLAGDAGILYIDGEFLGFTRVMNGAQTQISNVYRGLFGTSPRTHAAGTRVFQVDPEHYGYGHAGSELNGDARWPYYFKLLDSLGGAQRSPRHEQLHSINASDVMRKPLRPRGLAIDGSRSPETSVSGPAELTWAATARVTGDSYPEELALTQDLQGPETYDIAVFVGDVYSNSLSVTAHDGLRYTIPFSTESGSVEVRVRARRGDPDAPNISPDYLSDGFATLCFLSTPAIDYVLLSGDLQTDDDGILLSGDAQTGADKLIVL